MSAEATPPSALPAPPPTGPEALPSLTACVFTLAEESCAIKLDQVREVVTIGALTRVPGAPPALLGVANVRGTIVPVVDLRPVLRLPRRSAGPGDSAVVLEDGDLRAALAVDRVVGLERFDTALPPHNASRFAQVARGALPSPGGVVTLLDGPTILARVRRAWMPVDGPVAV